jgi:FtsP/CotA-like multicopper oxidase with cupredoxin domain
VPPAPAADGIPVPLIRVKVGDLVVVQLTNNLTAESSSIHWHGIELDNDSDGTAVTQDAILPGQSYTYRFRTFRPGLFWFHPHMAPGSSTFAGMYGAIVIENDIEESLKGTVLPTDASTHELVLSDIRFDAAGVVGFQFDGATHTVNELVEICHTTNRAACGIPHTGDVLLVNGQQPTASTPTFTVASGERVRLRLFDAAIARQFRLGLSGSADDNLYRIGGEGGLLDDVRLEGGTQGT